MIHRDHDIDIGEVIGNLLHIQTVEHTLNLPGLHELTEAVRDVEILDADIIDRAVEMREVEEKLAAVEQLAINLKNVAHRLRRNSRSGDPEIAYFRIIHQRQEALLGILDQMAENHAAYLEEADRQRQAAAAPVAGQQHLKRQRRRLNLRRNNDATNE